jgi:hypothetical protein
VAGIVTELQAGRVYLHLVAQISKCGSTSPLLHTSS